MNHKVGTSQKKINTILNSTHINALYFCCINDDKPKMRKIRETLRKLIKNPELIRDATKIFSDQILIDLMFGTIKDPSSFQKITGQEFLIELNKNESIFPHPLTKEILGSISLKSENLLKDIEDKNFPFTDIDIPHYANTAQGREKAKIKHLKKKDDLYPLRLFIYRITRIISKNVDFKNRNKKIDYIIELTSTVSKLSKHPQFHIKNEQERIHKITDLAESIFNNYS